MFYGNQREQQGLASQIAGAAIGQTAGQNLCNAQQAKQREDYTVEQVIDKRISQLMGEIEQLQLAKSRLSGIGAMSANEFRKMLGGIGY